MRQILAMPGKDIQLLAAGSIRSDQLGSRPGYVQALLAQVCPFQYLTVIRVFGLLTCNSPGAILWTLLVSTAQKRPQAGNSSCVGPSKQQGMSIFAREPVVIAFGVLTGAAIVCSSTTLCTMLNVIDSECPNLSMPEVTSPPESAPRPSPAQRRAAQDHRMILRSHGGKARMSGRAHDKAHFHKSRRNTLSSDATARSMSDSVPLAISSSTSDTIAVAHAKDNRAGPRNSMRKGFRPTKHTDLPPRLSANPSKKPPQSLKQGTRTLRARHTNDSSGQSSHRSASPSREISVKSKQSDSFRVDGVDDATLSPSPYQSIASVDGLRVAAELQSPVSLSQRVASSGPDESSHQIGTPEEGTLAPDKPAISLYKQTHTTLRVSCSDKLRFVPVKLRSCVTMPKFFSSVLAACDLEDQREKIDDVTARFGWLPEEHAMVIKEKIPDSFAEFLETIDGAPCWNLGVAEAKCHVNIEVFLKGA